MKSIQEIKEAFASRIKEELKVKSILIFSKETGISKTALNNWLNKKSLPNASNLIIIAKKLKVRINYLLGLDDYSPRV